MEWLETSARSVDDAKEWLLDHLGVDASDAEFEVLEEPRSGLFGRVKGEARVRGRVRPSPVRQKPDRRDRKRRDKADRDEAAATGAATGAAQGSPREGQGQRRQRPARQRPAGQQSGNPVAGDQDVAAGTTATATRESSGGRAKPARQRQGHNGRSTAERADTDKKEQTVSADQVGDEARRFMDGLVEAFGLTGTSSVVTDGDDIEVQVNGEGLGLLVGPRGTTLQAIQDLVRVASQRRLGDHDTRLRLDVGGYRERRREALGRFAAQVAADVVASDEPRALEPMTSSDRKIVHDVLGTIEGIVTRSEGEDPNRRVVISPASVD